MYEITSDQKLDQIVWSLIKDTCNLRNHLGYLRLKFNSPAQQEEAFQAESKYCFARDEHWHFCKSVADREELAHEGNEFSIFTLVRWY